MSASTTPPVNTPRKSPKTNSTATPSGGSTVGNGEVAAHARLRSVLSHPLGLPLVEMLHGNDPSKLEYFPRESHFFSNGGESKEFDDLFSDAVSAWQDSTNRDEPGLTAILSDRVNHATDLNSETEVEPKKKENPPSRPGSIDLVLWSNEAPTSTPLVIMEFGRFSSEWWKKFDQNLKYLDNLWHQDNTRLQFGKPLLFVVLTIQGEGTETDLCVKLAVFLCSSREDNEDPCRLSLLWHSETTCLMQASKDFARLLRATSDFNRWREVDPEQHWTYLGPNCCKVVTTDPVRCNLTLPFVGIQLPKRSLTLVLCGAICRTDLRQAWSSGATTLAFDQHSEGPIFI
jgi:hypothetical protein